MRLTQFFGLVALPLLVNSLASTDETQAADPPQSGYLPNHNISPDTVTQWVKVKNTNFNTPGESFYGTPLVYTPPGFKNELVIIVSDQNIIRVIDGITSNMYKNRTVDAPFSSLDANCNNDGSIGITGTPFIDPATGIMYFYSKGYINGKAGPQGTLLGIYKLWALQLPDLGDVPGFPVSVTGPTVNDKTRYFVGGTLMQRPGLTMVGDSIVAGFGGHCDSMNYTGMLVTVSKTPGKGVTSIYAMEASPGAPAQGPDWKTAKGGKAGIWQSGMGLATDLDNNRVFFATGNSDSPGDLGGPSGSPASGKVPISTLGQAIVDMGIDPVTGVITQKDYFIPTNYVTLNAGDKDISSSGVSLLDHVPFSGGGVNRVAISGSKAGYIYVMDADNLGGFKNGPGGTDGILQTLFFSGKTFYNGIGSYPGEGGWVYICSSSSALQAYKLVFNSNGQPNIQLVAQSAITHGCHGSPTVTSLNGKPGSAIVWLADTTQGLTAYRAVPDPGSSVLTPVPLPGSGGLTKFHRPTFGNNRVYVTTGDSLVIIGGTPANVPPASSSSSLSSSTKLTSTSRVSSSTLSSTIKSSSSSSVPVTSSSSATLSSSSSSVPTTSSSSAVPSSTTVYSSSTTVSDLSSSSTDPSTSTSDPSSTSSLLSSSTTDSSTTTSLLSSSTWTDASSTTSDASSTSLLSSSTTLLTMTSGISSSSLSSSSLTSSSAGITSTSSSAIPTATADWNYVGCYADAGKRRMRALATAATMNIEACLTIAEAYTLKRKPTVFKAIALQSGSVCFAATAVPTKATTVAGPAACTMTCAGNSPDFPVETCGGNKQYNLYANIPTDSITALPPPVKTIFPTA